MAMIGLAESQGPERPKDAKTLDSPDDHFPWRWHMHCARTCATVARGHLGTQLQEAV